MPIIVNGIFCSTESELESAIADLSEEQKLYIRNDFYGAPNPNVPLSELPKLQIMQVVNAAADFGQSVMVTFAAENVLLGITQEGKTGEVLSKLAGVQLAMQAGSLHEAIARIRQIPPEHYDAKYITAPRLLIFINKIEAYLGLPLSSTL